MALYGEADVNWATGQTTIQARVQNQAYQQAAQADLATGANVVNRGQRSLAQVGSQNLDLSLLRGQKVPKGPISMEWIELNITVDRTVDFGSDEYFALAADPDARAHLQSGVNVIFAYRGKVVSVQDPAHQGNQQGSTQSPQNVPAISQVRSDQGDRNRPSISSLLDDIAALLDLLASFAR